MPRPDTGTFNRLLTSVGLIFMAAALVIPYFYFQSNDTLMVERQKLDRLTETARDAIEDRQSEVASLQPWVLPFSGALIVVGLGLLLWGGYRLRSTQARDDREAEARTIRAEAGLRTLTPEEKEEKIAEDAEGSPEDADQSEPAPPTGSADARASARLSRDDRLEAARRIERKIVDVFSAAELDGYLFRPQVAVGRLKLDGLFISVKDEPQPDVLLDVTISPANPPSLFTNRLLGRVVRYEAERGRRCRPWLIVVIPTNEPAASRARETIEQTRARLDEELMGVGVATVIQENEIAKLPLAFDGIERLRGPDSRDTGTPES